MTEIKTDTEIVISAHDLLLQLSPPIRLVGWLEKTFDAKAAKGEIIPPEFCRWLDRWRAIRGDGASEIDYVTAEEWAALGEKVKE